MLILPSAVARCSVAVFQRRDPAADVGLMLPQYGFVTNCSGVLLAMMNNFRADRIVGF